MQVPTLSNDLNTRIMTHGNQWNKVHISSKITMYCATDISKWEAVLFWNSVKQFRSQHAILYGVKGREVSLIPLTVNCMGIHNQQPNCQRDNEADWNVTQTFIAPNRLHHNCTILLEKLMIIHLNIHLSFFFTFSAEQNLLVGCIRNMCV